MALLLNHMPIRYDDWPFAPLRPFSLLDPTPLKKARRDYLKVKESEAAYSFSGALPGVAADGVTLRVSSDGLLTLTAKADQSHKHQHFRQEYHHTLRLAKDADLDSVKAACVDGLLEVTVAKKAPPAPINLEVLASTCSRLDDKGDPPHYEFHEDVPGVGPSEVSVQLVPQLGYHHTTASYQLLVNAASTKGFGTYRFRYNLPADAMAEGASAHCCHGRLHVRVPRRAPHKVTVPVADSVDSHPISAKDSPEDEQPPVELVHVKVAGYAANQVTMEATRGVLRIKLQKQDQGQPHCVEQRVLLPDEVDLDTLRASCADGLLVVRAAPLPPKERTVPVAADRPEIASPQAAGSH